MAESAHVDSLEALRDFRAALCGFMEEAKNALMDVDFELDRAIDWLNHDRRMYWASAVRTRGQDWTDAKAALHRKKLGKIQGSHPDTSAEEKAVRFAKGRYEEAEEKVEVVRAWIPELQHAAQEYRSQAIPLGDMVDGELKNAVAKLDRMITALESYLSLHAPTTPSVMAGSGFASAAAAPAATPTSEHAAPELAGTDSAQPSSSESESAP
jgi:hypothetical protein